MFNGRITTELYFDQSVTTVTQMDDRITFKSVLVAVMQHLSIHHISIDPKISHSRRLENQTEGLEIVDQVFRPDAQGRDGDRRIGEIARGRGTDRSLASQVRIPGLYDCRLSTVARAGVSASRHIAAPGPDRPYRRYSRRIAMRSWSFRTISALRSPLHPSLQVCRAVFCRLFFCDIPCLQEFFANIIKFSLIGAVGRFSLVQLAVFHWCGWPFFIGAVGYHRCSRVKIER